MEQISIPTGLGEPLVFKGKHVILAFALGVAVGIVAFSTIQQNFKQLPQSQN